MSTKIDPKKFLALNHTKYMKLLLRDLKVLGRSKKTYDFIFAHPYKFDSKKASLLLFADAEAEEWLEVAKAIKVQRC